MHDNNGQAVEIGFASDFDALKQLYELNQLVEQADREFEEAKLNRKAATESRDNVLRAINGYVANRRVEVAQTTLLNDGFKAGPDWLNHPDNQVVDTSATGDADDSPFGDGQPPLQPPPIA